MMNSVNIYILLYDDSFNILVIIDHTQKPLPPSQQVDQIITVTLYHTTFTVVLFLNLINCEMDNL